MCVDIKEPLPNASLWDRLKLENEMLRSFHTKVVYKIRETRMYTDLWAMCGPRCGWVHASGI